MNRFVEDDGAVVLHRLLALDEGSHGRQRAHQPLHVRGRVVGGGLDGCALAFDVQNLEGHASAMICRDTGLAQHLPRQRASSPLHPPGQRPALTAQAEGVGKLDGGESVDRVAVHVEEGAAHDPRLLHEVGVFAPG